MLLGRSGEEGDGSASESLRKNVYLVPTKGTRASYGELEGRAAQADLITVFYEAWALIGVVNIIFDVNILAMALLHLIWSSQQW